jgi:hypothetical protein
MLMFLLSLAFVAIVFGIGILVVPTLSIIPPSILARTAEAGRYVRLGPHERPSRSPGAGRRRASQAGCRRARTLAGTVAR